MRRTVELERAPAKEFSSHIDNEQDVLRMIDAVAKGSLARRILDRVGESRLFNTRWEYYRELRKPNPNPEVLKRTQ